MAETSRGVVCDGWIVFGVCYGTELLPMKIQLAPKGLLLNKPTTSSRVVA
ncbi:mCG1036207 [Mus musculus]|nr:mCG1036207 [Mus musculus]